MAHAGGFDKEVLGIMQTWGREKSPSTGHQFAVLNVFTDESEAYREELYVFADTETRWFDPESYRPYTVHADAFLVGNPSRKQPHALRVTFEESKLGELKAKHGENYLRSRKVLIYSNHDPCKYCKQAISEAKRHFGIQNDVVVGYEMPGSMLRHEGVNGVKFIKI